MLSGGGGFEMMTITQCSREENQLTMFVTLKPLSVGWKKMYQMQKFLWVGGSVMMTSHNPVAKGREW